MSSNCSRKPQSASTFEKEDRRFRLIKGKPLVHCVRRLSPHYHNTRSSLRIGREQDSEIAEFWLDHSSRWVISPSTIQNTLFCSLNSIIRKANCIFTVVIYLANKWTISIRVESCQHTWIALYITSENRF